MLATAAPTTPLFMPTPAEGAAAERAIVIAAQRGADDAFSALVRIHQRRAYAIVRAIVLSHEDAEGVALPDHGECGARPRAPPQGA
jgi:hypothetical protein